MKRFWKFRKQSAQKESNWFKRNEHLITFVTSIAALIVSIIVMLDQKKTSQDNIKLVQRQIDLAQAQFDTSNADRIALGQRELALSQRQERIDAHQDSINMAHLNLVNEQIKNQIYNNMAQLASDKPIMLVDSVHVTRGNRIMFWISNRGKRPLTSYDLSFIGVDYINKTVITEPTLQSFRLHVGHSVIAYFDSTIADSILSSEDFICILKGNVIDDITKTKESFFYGIVPRSSEKNTDIASFLVTDPKYINLIKKFLRTRDWQLLEKLR